MTGLYFVLVLILMLGFCKPDGKYSESKYFENKDLSKGTLDEIQGALWDISLAKLDLKIMETRLQAIVDSSSYFFNTENEVEKAVDTDAYENGWKDNEESSAPVNEGKAYQFML